MCNADLPFDGKFSSKIRFDLVRLLFLQVRHTVNCLVCSFWTARALNNLILGELMQLKIPRAAILFV